MSTDLTFNSGTTTRTVMVPIVGDNVDENAESFSMSLTNTAGDSAVMLNPSTTTVTIENDDGKFFAI